MSDKKSAVSRVGSNNPAATNTGTWVQTDRATHEAWGQLTLSSPRASALAHFMVANMESSGALVASYATLAQMTGMSVSTVRRAIDDLRAGCWLDVVQIGGKGGANAFLINSRVGWGRSRNELDTALFTANVLVNRAEQSVIVDTPLRRIPVITAGERQLPSGDGLDPPSQPFLPDLEPDLPAVVDRPEEQLSLLDAPSGA